MSEINIDDFAKLDIRIGTIRSAKPVEGSEKLGLFEIDLGSETRQIVGGLAKAYPDLEELVGKQVPVLTNLAPRSLMGIESQGMILAASAQDQPVVMHPEKPVEPGTKVR